ncbi:hypothetical protein GWO43_31200 [candidate division KSB1 bacterium]|nr:hypothetical protein [candidate division KSB1 bacterium]NIV71085.1 hypothetical protein [Phycisphaerae bacterium]NIR72364.1 hypothetical protein [candidate division KSB1 bacterium]NIS28367.1 hypothetical protein [candidate division KSB1 bacterium]NIT75248.1 hypothetical protein [candidate division KSB1 bacterium]
MIDYGLMRGVRRRLTAKRFFYDYEYDENLRHFCKCLQFIRGNRIEGDILEFGVFRGATLIIIDEIIKRIMNGEHQKSPQIYGFDSFEGLPEPKGKDTKHPEFRRGKYRCTKEDLLQRLRKAKVNIEKVHIVEGWYEDVLTSDLRKQLGIKKASLIDIDCDLYQSTVTALNWCEPSIGQGTIISFDDWYCYEGRPDHGEQHAFNQFLALHPDITAKPFSEYSWHGKSFIITRNSR